MTRVEPSNPAGDMLFLRHLLLFASQLLSITPTVAWQARVLEVTKMCLIKCLSFVFFSFVALDPIRVSLNHLRDEFCQGTAVGAPRGGVAGISLACPTASTAVGSVPAQSRVSVGHWGNPSPAHLLPPWEWAEARLGPGWVRPGWAGLWPHWDRGWWPRGLTWGQELWDGLVKEGLLVPWALDTFQSSTRPNFVLKMCKIYSLAQ